MDNAIHAMIMAFSAMVFVFGLSLAMYMFTQVTSTSETMFYLSDKTNFYENIDLKLTENATEKRKRIVEERPNREELKKMIRTLSFVQIGK